MDSAQPAFALAGSVEGKDVHPALAEVVGEGVRVVFLGLVHTGHEEDGGGAAAVRQKVEQGGEGRRAVGNLDALDRMVGQRVEAGGAFQEFGVEGALFVADDGDGEVLRFAEFLGGGAVEAARGEAISAIVGGAGEALGVFGGSGEVFGDHADALGLAGEVAAVAFVVEGPAGGLDEVVLEPLLAVALAKRSFHGGALPEEKW